MDKVNVKMYGLFSFVSKASKVRYGRDMQMTSDCSGFCLLFLRM